MSVPRKLRLLMLHGHAQTGEEMAMKCGALRSEIKKMAEFHKYESPIKNAKGEQTHYDFEAVTSDVSKYSGVERGLANIVKVFEEEGPFDGVWGFSMGAVMAHLLAEQVSKGALPPFVTFNFAILFSAPSSKDPAFTINGPIDIPSFHCYGTSDAIIPAERSKMVADTFVNPTTVVHEGGHLMPSFAPVRKSLKEFVKAQREKL